MRLPDAIRPDWAVPATVTALMSTRAGGVSAAPFDSLNLRPPALGGADVDVPAAIAENQRRFAAALGAQPVWLHQVHGAQVLTLTPDHLAPSRPMPRADASISAVPGIACAVLVADCLPVLLCSRSGRVVGAAHAGWRGLAAGVIEATVLAMADAGGDAPADMLAWLGPCIGPTAFEVGADVLMAFGADPDATDPRHFVPRPLADGSRRWLANLPQLARQRLAAMGVLAVGGGQWCTYRDASRFFSFRRQPCTGRMAAAVAMRG